VCSPFGAEGDVVAENVRVRAIVIDPYPACCEGISNYLSRGGHVILGQGRDLENGLRQLHSLKPNLVILGPHLRQPQSLTLCRELKRRRPSVNVIIMAEESEDPRFLVDVASAGAVACLPGDVGEEELLSVVDAVVTGRVLFPREILSQSYQLSKLTEREQQVLRLLSEGKTDREVAETLGLARSTIRNHSQRILDKLEVHSRAEAVKRARRLGWI
jgi:DNA-binding NarL/FixJ family response regulator